MPFVATIIVLLNVIHRPVSLSKTYNVSETGLCLSSGGTYSDPVDRASSYLHTLAPAQDRIYKPSTT
jgi:hypothetical protein